MTWFLILCSFIGDLPTFEVQRPGLIERGVALPQGTAFSLKMNGGQVDVISHWPDGSIKHAAVTAFAQDDKPMTLRKGLKPVSQATLECDIGGVVYRAAFDFGPSGIPFRQGPVCQAYRKSARLVANGVVHPWLLVWADTYSYADGQSIRLGMEHSINSVGAPKGINYRVTVKLDNETVLGPLDRYHGYGCIWSERFDRVERGYVKTDLEPYFKAGALDRPGAVSEAVPPLDFSHPKWLILGRGYVGNSDMTDHGGRPDMACRTAIANQWAKSQHEAQWIYLLKTADRSGSWPKACRYPDTLELISIDRSKRFWYDKREQNRGDTLKAGEFATSPAIPKPYSDLGTGYTLRPDNAHQPSLVRDAWIMTGDPYYADELASWAAYCLISQWPGSQDELRQGSRGILSGEVRARAYALRNVSDAAAWLPDGYPLKEYFASKVQNNLTYYDEQTDLRILEGRDHYSLEQAWEHRPFQDNILAWAIHKANVNGFQGGGIFLDRIVQFQMQFSDVNSIWPIEKSTMYRCANGVRTGQTETVYDEFLDKNVIRSQVDYFPTVKEMLDYNERLNYLRSDQVGGGDYLGSTLVGLKAGAKRGYPGASEAVAKLEKWAADNKRTYTDGWRVEP